MKAVIQRVTRASVEVNSQLVSEIGKGLLILVCVVPGDTHDDVDLLVRKISKLRIFDDERGVMNLSLTDISGEVLCVSQFTLAASVRKGNRPSYIGAAAPDLAVPMYDLFCDQLSAAVNSEVRKGIFGADMQVSLVNDGPVTILMDSNNMP